MSDSTRKSIPKAAAEAYGKVVEHATLQAIRLISSSFEVSPQFREDDDGIRRNIRQEAKCDGFNRASGAVLGMVQCRCWMTPREPKDENSEPETNLLSIKAQYVVFFTLKGDHTDESVETFFNRVAPISVWPYFRTHVATIAAEADLSIPVLPIKRLVHRVKAAAGYIDPDESKGQQ